MADLADALYAAGVDAQRAGGPNTAAGRVAFGRSLVRQFNSTYA